MKNNQKFIFVIVILFLSGKVQLWEYSEQDQWPELYPGCDGDRQSPINLSTSALPTTESLELSGFDEEFDLSSTVLLNNGHSVQLTGDTTSGEVPTIIIDGTKFGFNSLHFHWGSTSDKGAEHLIDGVQYAMELHIVHMNEKYESIEEAQENSDGLAVLGIFFLLTPFDSRLAPIIDHLSEVVFEGSTTQLTTSFSLNSLTEGLETDSFFRYAGSLTTPNCSESVTWTVFENPLIISEYQISEFRQLLDANENPIVDNFRDPQPIGSRTIGYTVA